MTDELDLEVFTCCKCGGEFNHVDGTWLPMGEEEKKMLITGDQPKVIHMSDFLRPPEVVTSQKFTCYDCTT